MIFTTSPEINKVSPSVSKLSGNDGPSSKLTIASAWLRGADKVKLIGPLACDAGRFTNVTLVDIAAAAEPVAPPRAVGTLSGVACARRTEHVVGVEDKVHKDDDMPIISPVLKRSLSFTVKLNFVTLVILMAVSYGANCDAKVISINPLTPEVVRCSNINRVPAGYSAGELLLCPRRTLQFPAMQPA